MKLDAKQITAIDEKIRVLLINSLSGFKSANLVGTCDAAQQANLAIVSSVVHIGANPPLLGMIMRPHSVPRGTLENIINTGVYTLNHVHAGIYEKAHQTSARYPQGSSEFREVGLTEQWESNFAAPFVAESVIKMGMKLREQKHLTINGTELIIGEIVSIEIPDEVVSQDGYVSLEKADSVAISSLDSYHKTQLLSHLRYAKPGQSTSRFNRHTATQRHIGREKSSLSIVESRQTTATETPKCVIVVGANGGIGRAYCRRLLERYANIVLIRMVRKPCLLPKLDGSVTDICLDINNDKSIELAIKLLPENIMVDWVFIATGWLHDKTIKPEKTYAHLDREHLLNAYSVNAVGPMLFIKNLLGSLQNNKPMKIGILTARVGSISDNRLGGWHSYRCSKSALNMLIKNFSIELKNKQKPVTIVGLQPGTTDTPLSAPFQRGMLENQLQTPEFTADHLIDVMNVLESGDSGKLFDFEGLQFEP